ncbi:phage head morphogenesis protein [Staphylococcus coagulans]|uniref:minor capsid protein n=1 Tax=Staphylococcus coagulans TaxID=74706 RepID=UPI000CD00F8A|nr:minor capsid protein [Staphylococcus coagulans]MDK3706553.1 minor capsid protein [Staphylococcus pseudintermedius]MDK3823707.1 minor capsid protein [Staphylococcus pseudintermedius]PNZ10622.1 phage head morphogenesis protein [Staphylococcus coagulans]
MSDSLDYWLERAQNTINSELIEDAKAAAELQRIVTLMYAEIAKELLAFYAKYATAEGLTIAEAKKIVDEFDVVAFQNKAKVLVKNKDFSKEANKQLKKYNTKMYVSREKLLKQNLDLLVTEASIKVENHIEKSLVKAIDREVERQSGILGTDINVTDKKIKAVVNGNFKGVTWSERLWDDMDLVRKEVERVATNVVNRGRHPNEYVADFKKKTGATTHDAKRLLVTESARVQTEAQKLSYLETLGEDGEYEFVAKRDEKTSKVCRHHDKKVYKVKDMTPGVNAPPMHPHCRSTTIPRLGNWRDDFFKKRKGKYKLDEEETTQLLAKKEMTDAIDSGKIKVELNVEKQNRHQLGHQLYEDYKKKNLQKGKAIPSYTLLDNSELNSLIHQKAGKGSLIADDFGNWKNKEIIDFGKIIGKDYIDGEFIETKRGTVHYSKTGSHIIPNGKGEKR